MKTGYRVYGWRDGNGTLIGRFADRDAALATGLAASRSRPQRWDVVTVLDGDRRVAYLQPGFDPIYS